MPDHLNCLLRNLYAGQEETVRTERETSDWFQVGKGVLQGCILSPCLFKFYAEYIMRNARLDESQAGIKTSLRNINNLRYADDTTLIVESEEELKSLLMKVKEESEKAGLKHTNPKTKIMASSPITSWQIDGEKWKQWQILFSWLLKSLWKVTAAVKLRLLGRKAMTNLDSVLKSRDIALLRKVFLVKAMVFPIVMYGCESWTIKKVPHPRIDAFEPCCWRRLFGVPWTARRSNQLILNESNSEFIGRSDAEAPILWPTDVKRQLTGKDSDPEKD